MSIKIQTIGDLKSAISQLPDTMKILVLLPDGEGLAAPLFRHWGLMKNPDHNEPIEDQFITLEYDQD